MPLVGIIFVTNVYFACALLVAGLASQLTSDCWTEQRRDDFDACTAQASVYFFGVLLLAVAGYAAIVSNWRARK